MQESIAEDIVRRLQRLEDIEAIKRLKARYFWGLDKKDWALWATVFTDDVEADFSDDYSRAAGRPVNGLIKGRDNLVRLISTSVPPSGIKITSHQGHMPIIDFTGPDTATGVWELHDFIDFGDRRLTGFGHYHEEYVHCEGEWLIRRYAERRIYTRWDPEELGPPPYLRVRHEEIDRLNNAR